MLAYFELPYTPKSYATVEEWFGKEKEDLNLDYPNLPYLIDGDIKLTEAAAIVKYLALKAGKKSLVEDNDEKFIKVETAVYVLEDLWREAITLIRVKDGFNAAKDEAFSNGTIKKKLDILNKNLEGKEWLTGFLSVADFELYETVELFNDIDKSKLEAFPNIVAFHKRFNELPQIKTYKQSDKFKKAWFPPGMFGWSNAEK